MMPRLVCTPRPGLPSSALQIQSPLILSEMVSGRGAMLDEDAVMSVGISDRST